MLYGEQCSFQDITRYSHKVLYVKLFKRKKKCLLNVTNYTQTKTQIIIFWLIFTHFILLQFYKDWESIYTFDIFLRNFLEILTLLKLNMI